MNPIIIISAIKEILGKVIKDKDQVERLAHDLSTQYHDLMKAQIELNQTEARFGGTFRAGWRPLVGWICGTALLWHFILHPIILFVCALYGFTPDMPQFDMGSLMTILLGMLGLGTMRTFEKQKGIK